MVSIMVVLEYLCLLYCFKYWSKPAAYHVLIWTIPFLKITEMMEILDETLKLRDLFEWPRYKIN